MQAKIFESDFQEERKDRERAQGNLEELLNKGHAEPFQDPAAALYAEIAETRSERNNLKTTLVKVEAILKIESQVLARCRDERDYYKMKERDYMAELMQSNEVIYNFGVRVEELANERSALIEDHKREMENLAEQVCP